MARIMREQDLRVRPKRPFAVTTDGDHDGPIVPNLYRPDELVTDRSDV